MTFIHFLTMMEISVFSSKICEKKCTNLKIVTHNVCPYMLASKFTVSQKIKE